MHPILNALTTWKGIPLFGGLTVLVLGLLWYLPNNRTRTVALVCVAALVLLVLGIRFVFRWRARRKGQAMAQSLDSEHQSALEVSPEEQKARVAEIRRRFNEAVEDLRRARKSIYDLPWFLLIGEPQSGKSMTLRGSDLNFPIGTERLSGLGGTQNCDWWFTNQAVILDTAGRFTFQEAGAPDRAEWDGFLALLAKRRKQCPINGVLVVVPVDALLNDPSEVRKDKAKNIHSKLGELQHTLGVQFPVFVLITKSDLVLGFSEFFRGFGDVEAAQIVGWSREGAFDRAFDAAEVEQGLEEVYHRMCQRRLELLREPVNIEERGLIYEFPEEFRTLREPLLQYLGTMFAEDIFHEPLFFRGFYFTSGMQEGAPIVKVGREILGAGHAGTEEQEFDPLGSLFPSRPFFIADFYREKALRESGMVFRSTRAMRRAKLLKRLTYIGGGALGLLLAAGLAVGGFRINSMIRAPLKDAHEAHTLIVDPEAAPEPTAVTDELDTLATAADGLARGGWWFRLAFPAHDATQPVRDLRTIHDALYVRHRLRPLTSRLEQRLANAEAWTDECAAAHETSLREYVRWTFGQGPAVGDETTRAAAFDRLYGPVEGETGELGDYATLRSQFVGLTTEFDIVRRWAFDEAAGQRVLPQAITAAGAYFRRAFASESGRDLAPWWNLLRACERLAAKYRQLVAMAPTFEKVRTIGRYEREVAAWRSLYRGGPDAPGFQSAFEQVGEMLRRIAVEQRGDDGVRYVLRLPVAEDIRRIWHDYFGVPDGAGSDTLRAATSRGAAENPARPPTLEAIDRVVRELDAELARVIQQIEQDHATYQYLYDGAGPSAGLSGAAGVLAALDEALEIDRPPALGTVPDRWPDRLPPPMADPLRRLAQRDVRPGEAVASPTIRDVVGVVTDIARNLGPQWQTADGDLPTLSGAIAQVVARHQWYVELIELARLLGERAIETLYADAEQAVPPESVGFADLSRSRLRDFLERVLRDVERVQVRVRAAQRQEESLLRDLDTGGAAGEWDPDPALSAERAMESAVEAYGRRYFDDWGRVYGGQQLDGYTSLVQTPDWAGFVAALTSAPTRDIYKQAERCLIAFGESVLAADRTQWAADADTALREAREQHNRLLVRLRDNTPAHGQRFQALADALRRFGTELDSSHAAPQRLGRDAGDTFTRFRDSVTQLADLANWQEKARAGRRFEDLASQPLDELWARFAEERVLRQLENIARHGRTLLDTRLNNVLIDLIPTAARGADAPFPFSRPAAGRQTRELSQREFEAFAGNVLLFEQAFGSVQTAPAVSVGAGEAVGINRTAFLSRVKDWAGFLYGPDRTESDLALGQPAEVFFTIQYVEPRDHARVSEDYYTQATLALGRRDRESAAAGGAAGVRFDLLRERDPATPVTLRWRFGDPSDVTLTLSEPPVQSQYPPQTVVDGVTIAQTVWALPVFIYRYCSSDAWEATAEAGGARRQVWPVLVDIPTPGTGGRAQTVYALFRIAIISSGGQPCGLPPPIGSFQSGGAAPDLLDLD